MADQYQPPRQPAPAGGGQPYAPQLGAGLQTTGVIAGIFGVVSGVVPRLFLFAWAFGLVAPVVGVVEGEQT